MGEPPSSQPKEQRLRAFHAELFHYLFQHDRAGEIISSAKWKMLMGQGLGALSPKVAADHTFAMEVLGLIELTQPQNTGKQGRPGRGVIVLPPSLEPGQSPPGIVPPSPLAVA